MGKRKNAPDLTRKVANALWAGSSGGNITGTLSYDDCRFLALIALETVSAELQIKK